MRSLHCLPRIPPRGSEKNKTIELRTISCRLPTYLSGILVHVPVHILSFALGVTKNTYGQKPFHKPPRPGTCCYCPRRNMSQMTKPKRFSVFRQNKYGRVLNRRTLTLMEDVATRSMVHIHEEIRKKRCSGEGSWKPHWRGS